jgi:hypothetical protein
MDGPPRAWLRRHPLVRDALLWVIPAVILGAILRGLLLSYSPYAYWGADSGSYFGFSFNLLTRGEISLYDKRRYLYPIFLLPISLLPGSPLRWLAWVQPLIGLATLVPLAYAVRKVFAGWRWLIVPVTAGYACLPIVLWYEHELLAENLFFAATVWSIAGWCAWVGQDSLERSRAMWWWFFIPFACLVLTKASGLFFVPGMLGGIAITGIWRTFRKRELISFGALFGLMLTMGQESQGAWLLYTTAFPLTRLETPLHAEYKAEVRDMVERSRKDMNLFDEPDRTEWKRFLKAPEKQTERPLWAKLGEDGKFKTRLYKELAMEGIKAAPHRFLFLAINKIIGSANLSEFNESRFRPEYFVRKYRHLYEEDAERKPALLRFLFALPKDQPLPDYEEFSRRISPHPDSPAIGWLNAPMTGIGQKFDLVRSGDAERRERLPVAPLGWWAFAGGVLAWLPVYRRTFGVWGLIITSYLLGVFLVGGANPRFFGPAWPVLLLFIALPFDAALRACWREEQFRPA